MVREFCSYGTRDECDRSNTERRRCRKVYNLNTFWFIDPVTDIIGRFLLWLGSSIFTFGNVSRVIIN